MSGWTPLEKTLLSLSVLLLLTVVLLIVLGLSGGGAENEDGEASICLTKDCIHTANHILLKMDEDWDPCTNFYEFSCGGMNKTPEPLVSRTGEVLKGLLEISLDKQVEDLQFATSLYNNCVDFTGLKDGEKKPDEILRELMSRFEVGTWPVVDAFFDVDSKLSIDERLAGLALLGIPVAYKIGVSQSNGSFILKLSPGGPQVYGKSAEEIREDAKLRTHLLSSFHLLGARYDRAITDAADIISVDMGYATIDQKSPCNTVEYLTAEKAEAELNRLLQLKHREVNWGALLSAVKGAAGLKLPVAVELHCREKIRDYMTYFEDLSDRSVYNYLGWRFYSYFEKHIVPEFSHLLNVNSLRWMECIALIEQYSSQTVTEALVRHYLPDATVQELQRMTEDIESNYQSHFSTKEGTKKQLNETFKKLNDLLASLRHVKDSKKRTATFSQDSWRVDSSNYTAVVIDLRRQSVAKELKKLNPDSRNISTSSRSLLLSLLAAEEMHFSVTAKWLIYGSVGTVLSRELYSEVFKDVWASCLKTSDNCLWTFLNQTQEESLMSFIDACTVEVAYENLKKLGLPEKTHLPGIKENHLQMFLIVYAQRFCGVDEYGTRGISNKKRLNAFATHSAVFQETFHCPSSATKCSTIVKS